MALRAARRFRCSVVSWRPGGAVNGSYRRWGNAGAGVTEEERPRQGSGEPPAARGVACARPAAGGAGRGEGPGRGGTVPGSAERPGRVRAAERPSRWRPATLGRGRARCSPPALPSAQRAGPSEGWRSPPKPARSWAFLRTNARSPGWRPPPVGSGSAARCWALLNTQHGVFRRGLASATSGLFFPFDFL